MNSIYSWGSNQFHKVSPVTDPSIFSPTINLELENLAPSKVAAGDNHTLVLNEYGDIYSFGRGIQGELGHMERGNLSRPKLVEGFQNEVIVDIACGSVTSYAVTASGAVYQWGLVHAHSNPGASAAASTNTNTETGTGATSAPGSSSSSSVAVDNPHSTSVAKDTNDSHNHAITEEDEFHAASAGELTGLARDQTTTYVSVDADARVEGLHAPVAGPRQLREIVRYALTFQTFLFMLFVLIVTIK